MQSRSITLGWAVRAASAWVLAASGGAAAAPPPDPGSRGVDWTAVRARVETHPWAKAALADLRKHVAAVRTDFPEPPFGVSGWGHDYYCEKDAGKLRYDPKKPKEHVCSKCGEVYTDERRNEAWVDSTYKRIHRAVRQAGILFRAADDREAADYGRRMLLWFAANYERFQVHGKHAGKGRIMGQSLCEATSLVDLTLGYWDLLPALSAADRETIAQRLLLPSAALIHKQTTQIHNIHSWHNAAVGLIGLAVGNAGMVDAAVDGPHGLEAQIAKGVLADGFWYEGSIGYHFYTVSSLRDFIVALDARGRRIRGMDRFRRMFEAPLDYACGDGVLPAINDGWAGGGLAGEAPAYEMAARLWPDDPRIPAALAAFYRSRPRTSEQALLFGPDTLPAAAGLPKRSALLPATGYAILRDGGLEALLKFGPYGGGHDHLDRLMMLVYADGKEILPDLGTAGYGIKLNRWFRSPAAHNMLVVDGKTQAKCGGVLSSFTSNRVEASVADAYPGVVIRRTLAVHDGDLGDLVKAASAAEHTYDLFHHVRGTLESCSVELADAAIPGGGDGYEWLKKIRGGRSDGRVAFTLRLRDLKKTLEVECSSSAPFEVFTGACPDNPADRELTFLLLRRKGMTADFTTQFRVR